jgi:protein translocase SecG subunit
MVETFSLLTQILLWPLCLGMIGLILLQGGAGDLSSAFGGGGMLDSTLGVGASRKMAKVTAWMGGIFFVCVLFLAIPHKGGFGKASTTGQGAKPAAAIAAPGAPVVAQPTSAPAAPTPVAATSAPVVVPASAAVVVAPAAAEVKAEVVKQAEAAQVEIQKQAEAVKTEAAKAVDAAKSEAEKQAEAAKSAVPAVPAVPAIPAAPAK